MLVSMEQDSGDHLAGLPPDLQRLLLRDLPWAARRTCRLFRQHADAQRTALKLRWPTHTVVRFGRAAAELRGLLARLPRLRSLTCRYCPDNRCVALVALPALTHLDLGESMDVSNADSLAACTRLQALSLAGCWRVRHLSSLSACVSLTSLDLSRVNAQDLAWLRTQLPGLTVTGLAITE